MFPTCKCDSYRIIRTSVLITFIPVKLKFEEVFGNLLIFRSKEERGVSGNVMKTESDLFKKSRSKETYYSPDLLGKAFIVHYPDT